MGWDNKIFQFISQQAARLGNKVRNEEGGAEVLETPLPDAIDVLLANLASEYNAQEGWNKEVSRCASLKDLDAMPSAERSQVIVRMVAFVLCEPKKRMPEMTMAEFDKLTLEQLKERKAADTLAADTYNCFQQLIKHLFKKQPTFVEAQLISIVNSIWTNEARIRFAPNAQTLKAVHLKQNSLSDELARELVAYSGALDRNSSTTDMRELAAKAKVLATGRVSELKKTVFLDPGELWSELAIAQLQSMADEQKNYWLLLLHHSSELSSAKPSAKWLKTAGDLLNKIGHDDFSTRMEQWLPLVGKTSETHPSGIPAPPHADMIRGLVWTCTLLDVPGMPVLLGDMAERCFKKVPEFGPRCPKVANACVGALSAMKSKEAIAQLGRLQSKAKHASSKDRVGKGLEAIAEQAGITVDELQEMNVPDFGMQEVGALTTRLGDYTAHLTIKSATDAELLWTDSKGKEIKSVPAAVKTEFAEEVKSLRRTEKELLTVLSAIRFRLEHSWIEQRHWRFSEWKERYLDHPVAASIARRLIWNFGGKAGIWLTDKLVDLTEAPLTVADGAVVELWHPIAEETSVVHAWRQLLHKHQISQPFKQAHREIYVLTDAERQTETYSNRFASHILRQHQFAQLCQQRGWKYHLQGGFDSHNTPTLSLPNWRMSVEFWVEAGQGEEMTDMGIFTAVTTDQVRFVREGLPLPVSEIVPIAFSEIMRDVDLFVGVCSIGNDPDWTDQGERRQYWHTYSFGDLTTSANSRKEALEQIVPYLKIADRCSFSERFLIVRGDIRIYKIHLGSGNIMMEPNDQYLCIVAGRGASTPAVDKLFLPFEGDHVLSVILSKAFMLAEDKKIKDPSITSQINRR